VTTPFPAAVERWAALRTAAQWEKKLAVLLDGIGVPVFLPTMSRLTVYQGKRRAVQVPLFGGYVFCSEADYLGNKAITPAVRSKVAQVLRPADPAKLRDELAGIADLLTDRELVQERVAGKVGDTVRIIGGPLVGHQGKVVKVRPNRWQLVVEVSMLGAKLEVEVDERMVERAV
jgi:transcription antitermination factor NusG